MSQDNYGKFMAPPMLIAYQAHNLYTVYENQN